MIEVIFWILLSYGLTTIVVYGSIFQGMRDWFKRLSESKQPLVSAIFTFLNNLTGCPMCFSVWSGFFLSFLIYSPISELYNTHQTISWFFDGILSSGGVWALNSIIEWFEENRCNNGKQD